MRNSLSTIVLKNARFTNNLQIFKRISKRIIRANFKRAFRFILISGQLWEFVMFVIMNVMRQILKFVEPHKLFFSISLQFTPNQIIQRLKRYRLLTPEISQLLVVIKVVCMMIRLDGIWASPFIFSSCDVLLLNSSDS